jgi:hypothetical protein
VLLVGAGYWVAAVRTMDPRLRELTWSPFQSPDVREICTHLTADEHAHLIEDAQQRGREIGKWIGSPGSLIAVFMFAVSTAAASFLGSWQLALVSLTLLSIYLVVSGRARMRGISRRSVESLCNTEWARSRGYTAADLRLRTFPWSKSKNLFHDE